MSTTDVLSYDTVTVMPEVPGISTSAGRSSCHVLTLLSVPALQHQSITCKRSAEVLYLFLQNDDDTSRGFGFVNFEDAEAAQAAVSALNSKQMEDKELYVGRAQKKSEREAALKQR